MLVQMLVMSVFEASMHIANSWQSRMAMTRNDQQQKLIAVWMPAHLMEMLGHPRHPL